MGLSGRFAGGRIIAEDGMHLGRAMRDPWVWGQVALIAAVLALSGPLGRRLPGHGGGWTRWAGFSLLALGLGVMLRGALDLGRNLTPETEPLADAQLVTRGIYEFVRHPIYLGLCLVLTAVPLLARSWVVALLVMAASFGYFEGKARVEERKLRVRFPRYREYAALVSRLVPFGWK
jgi:protein-S-isoprenylcysteine O-methyltransferase Ste14